MHSIEIKDTRLKVCVNGDPARVIAFDPEDVRFAERFYALLDGVKEKESEFLSRAKSLDEKVGTQREKAALLGEVCEYLNCQIDSVFGEGTSAALFLGAMTLGQYESFFAGITPIISSAREKAVDTYADGAGDGVMR